MSMFEVIWLACLVITHAIAYHMGKADAPEPFKPTNEAWVAVQCHAIDKQLELAKWRAEHEQTEKTTGSSDC